jgi:hypothetical protein
VKKQKLAEFKKQIGVGVVASVAAAIIVGLLAVNAFPMSPAITTTGPFGTPPNLPLPPVPFSAEKVSCSLSTGICTFTIVNNSTAPLALVGCQIYSGSHTIVVQSANGTYDETELIIVNGTVGGDAAVSGIPANSQVGASCSVPTSALANETVGSGASGGFTVKFLKQFSLPSGFQFPAGDEPTFSFQGTWSSSTNQTATTTVSSSTGTNPYPMY